MSATKFNGKVEARTTFPSLAVAVLTGDVYVTNRGMLPGVAVDVGSAAVAMLTFVVVNHMQLRVLTSSLVFVGEDRWVYDFGDVFHCIALWEGSRRCHVA